jgi:hypothetical protein
MHRHPWGECPHLPPRERTELWPGAVLPREQPFERSRIGARHIEYLHPASRPCHRRDRATADSERRSHCGQRGRGRLAVHGSLTDADHQSPIVLPAHAGTGRPRPDPDSNTHYTSVRPARPQSASCPVTATTAPPLLPLGRQAVRRHSTGQSSRWTVPAVKAGTQTEMYSAPSLRGVLWRTLSRGWHELPGPRVPSSGRVQIPPPRLRAARS